MGLLDYFTPVLLWVDENAFSIIRTEIKIILWGMIGALMSSLLFKVLINANKINQLKTEIKASQRELNNHDGEFSELKQLIKTTMGLSFKRLGATFLPSLAAAVPVVILLIFMSHKYDFETPAAPQTLDYQLTSLIPSKKNERHMIYWPQKGQTTRIKDFEGHILVTLPIKPVHRVHHKKWWNIFIANPAGYIPDESDISAVVFDFKKRSMGSFFDDYFSSWHWPFFIVLGIFSVIFFIIFRIKF